MRPSSSPRGQKLREQVHIFGLLQERLRGTGETSESAHEVPQSVGIPRIYAVGGSVRAV